MDSVSEADYKPPPEFIEDTKDSLVDLSMTDSKELWLIQWPVNQHPDFDGQELSLKLHQDGQLGKFEGSSGKLYNVVSFVSQDPDVTVFISSPSESKIVGKISRRVSLVHYPEPDELENQSANNLRKMYQRSGGSSLTHSSHHYSTPSHSTKLRNPQSVSGRSASTHSSRHKRRHADKPATSINQLTQDSGRGHSTVTSSGSLGLSHQGKSTKKVKLEG